MGHLIDNELWLWQEGVHFDTTRRALEISVMPEIWRIGCTYVSQLMKRCNSNSFDLLYGLHDDDVTIVYATI